MEHAFRKATDRVASPFPEVEQTQIAFFFFKQKTAYEIDMRLEFRRVLFRSYGPAGIEPAEPGRIEHRVRDQKQQIIEAVPGNIERGQNQRTADYRVAHRIKSVGAPRIRSGTGAGGIEARRIIARIVRPTIHLQASI